MSIMFILMIAAVIAIFAIKRRVDHLHHAIEEKIHTVMQIAQIGGDLIQKAKSTFKRND